MASAGRSVSHSAYNHATLRTIMSRLQEEHRRGSADSGEGEDATEVDLSYQVSPAGRGRHAIVLHVAILHWRLFADICEQSLRELEAQFFGPFGPRVQYDEGRTQPRAWRAAGVRVG
jgi:hypothetical protein